MIKDIFKFDKFKAKLDEQTRSAMVAPSVAARKLMVPDFVASRGYVVNNLPIVLDKLIGLMSREGRAEVVNLLKELSRYEGDLAKLCDVLNNLARLIEFNTSIPETSEISKLYRMGHDAAAYVGGLVAGTNKFLGNRR